VTEVQTLSTQLPNRWIRATLEDCVDILDGQRIPINAKERGARTECKSLPELYPYYGATGQVGWIDNYLFDEELLLLGEDGAPFLEPFKNKAYVIKGKSWVNNHAHVLRALRGLTSNSFLCFYLNTFNYHGFVSGTTRYKLNQALMRKIPIPIPPFAEQSRIVAKCEALFSFLDAGSNSLRKVQAQLKRYRQAVLKYAFEGKLTETWRRTHKDQIEPAQEMLAKAAFQFLRKQKTLVAPEVNQTVVLPDGWAKGRLENLIYIAGRIGWRGLKAEEYTQDGPLFLSVYNLNKGNIVDLSESYHVTEERYKESPEIQLKNDDILLAKDGAGIGKIGIVQGLTVKATVNSSLLVVRSGDVFRPKFLFYFLKGPRMQELVKSRISGSATPHLFQRDIRKFDLLIPPILEQDQIINEIESRLSIADQTEIVIKQSLKMGGTLWQTILKDAFEGKLVPQDPSDEPAEMLLKRIKDTKNYPSKSYPKGLISYVK
jgi:type I restriction enzyme S subunit